MTERAPTLDTIEITELPEEVAGCEPVEGGGSRCHLRICLQCGNVGCGDSSPARFATAHARESGHPIVRSIQPGETGARATRTSCCCRSRRST